MLLALAAGLFVGFALGNLGPGLRGYGRDYGPGNSELRERLEQVNRDLSAAIDSQREAAERASRLQAELLGITEYARSLEEGARRAEERAGSLEARIGVLSRHLDGIADQSVELSDGINRASSSLEESRVLLDELGTLLRQTVSKVQKS